MLIEYRQSAFSIMSTYFGWAVAVFNGKVPFDAKAAANNAALVAEMAKTDAEIWTRQAKFKEGGSKLIAESAIW